MSGFRAYDGNHAPKPPFRLNRASPQAKGLAWWVSLLEHRPIGREIISGALPDTQYDRTPSPRREVGGFGADNIGTSGSDSENIEWYFPPDLSFPYTITALCVFDDTVSWGSLLASSVGFRWTLGQDDAGNLIFQHTSGWLNNGPAAKVGELVLVGARVREISDWDVIQVSASSGLEVSTFTSNLNSGGLPISGSKVRIGQDTDSDTARIFRGPIFDVRMINRHMSDHELFDMRFNGIWDAYESPRSNYFVPAAAGGATIAHYAYGHRMF